MTTLLQLGVYVYKYSFHYFFYILKIYNLANNNNAQTNPLQKCEIVIKTSNSKKGYMLFYKMTSLAFLGDSGVENILNFHSRYDFLGPMIKIFVS